jgi:hypothetical protein
MAPDAEARRKRSFGGGGRSSYESNGKFGLGIELGGPSGLNGKYFLSGNTALNFGVGYDDERYYGYYYRRRGLHLYLDHLWHPVQLTETEPFKLPFYIGVGARLWSFDSDRNGDFGGTAIGVRVPLGLSFDFNNIPLDIFVQLTFVVDFLVGDYYDRYGDRATIHLEGSIGARYWFD